MSSPVENPSVSEPTPLATFKNDVDKLVYDFNNIVTLSNKMRSADPKAALLYQSEGGDVFFTMKDLKALEKSHLKALKELKKHGSLLKKRTREHVAPESLAGIYSPVFVDEGFRNWLNQGAAGFGFASPTAQSGPALIDQMPMASQGYFLRNTITPMFFIYAHQNNLQDTNDGSFTRLDQVMMDSFGGQFPSQYYRIHPNYDPDRLDAKGKPFKGVPVKKTMDQAVQDGDISAPMNAIQVLQSDPAYSDFDPTHFSNFTYQNIAALCYVSISNLDPSSEQAQFVADPANQEQLVKEFYLAKQVSGEWKELLKPERAARAAAKKRNA